MKTNEMSGFSHKFLDLIRAAFKVPIKVYQKFISPLLPSSCIYQPTCSQYALSAIDKHGVIRGLFLGIRRILRCNPFRKGGYDPVP